MVAIGLKVVLGPALMAVASLVIGLRDTLFKVAIVQVIFSFFFSLSIFIFHNNYAIITVLIHDLLYLVCS